MDQKVKTKEESKIIALSVFSPQQDMHNNRIISNFEGKNSIQKLNK